MKTESLAARSDTIRKLKEKNIEIHYKGKVKEITPKGVHLLDGRNIDCNAPIWATGAEP